MSMAGTEVSARIVEAAVFASMAGRKACARIVEAAVFVSMVLSCSNQHLSQRIAAAASSASPFGFNGAIGYQRKIVTCSDM